MKFNENEKLLPPQVRTKIKNQIKSFARFLIVINIVPSIFLFANGSVHDLYSFVGFIFAFAGMIIVLCTVLFILLVALASRKDRDKYL